MKVLLQRVSSASVSVDGVLKGKIKKGLLCFVGFTHTDGIENVKFLSQKLVNLRVFTDLDGKMNQSLLDVGGEILLISQFTLYGNSEKGRRPSFVHAARPEHAEPLYLSMIDEIVSLGAPCEKGVFGADMQVELINDGPITLMLEK